MREDVHRAVKDAIRAAQYLENPESIAFIEGCAHLISDCFEKEGKLLIAGNGGSLCDAMHFAEELTGYFRGKRKAFPAIALSCPGHLTCTANDSGYEFVFARAVEALGKPNDLFIALTTSGNSPNLVQAICRAKEIGLKTIAFLGKKGGVIKGTVDLEWVVGDFPFSDRVQEAHMAAIHIIIEMVERKFGLS
jgi:D-sedoheptulose 7-phosphate isomerase